MRRERKRHAPNVNAGHLRRAAETVLLARREFDFAAASVSRSARTAFRELTDRLTKLGAMAAVETATVQSSLMERRLPIALQTAAEEFDREAHRLLMALSTEYDRPQPAMFQAGPEHRLGQATNADRFGPAVRTYVAGILNDAEIGRTMSKDSAKSLTAMTRRQIDDTTDAIIAEVSPGYRDEARELLTHRSCYAVSTCGPQVPSVALEARTAWGRPTDTGTRRFSDRIHQWGINDKGRVVGVRHSGESAVSTKFVTVEAFAWSVQALLSTAARSGGLDAMLDARAVEDRAVIRVPASEIGLEEGNMLGFRPAGISTRESHIDWLNARRAAMLADDEASAPVRYRSFDPIVDADDPGVNFAFRRHRGQWALLTVYA